MIVKDLEEKDRITINLESEYCLLSNRALYLEEDKDSQEVLIGRIYELQKEGKPILSFRTKDDLTIHLGLAEVSCSTYRKKLSKFFTPYLEANEDSKTVMWILKQFNRDPIDIPPWERTEPVRVIRVRRDGATGFDKTMFDKAKLSLNEERNATRFENECKEYLVYAADKESWYAWVVNHWEEARDKIWQAARFVSETILQEYKQWEDEYSELDKLICENQGTTAAATRKKEQIELKQFIHAMKNHVNSSKSDRGMRAMLNICANSTMRIDIEKVSDVNLLAFKNGILDTKEGKIYQNEQAEQFKERYPTVYVDCTYTKGAVSKAFNEHLWKVFWDNTTLDLSKDERIKRFVEVGRYFSRWLGYLLVAGNPEQIMLFLWGNGANGKSTTLDIIRDILGDEVAEASIKELYATSEDKPAGGISNGLPRRCLMFSEASDSDEKTYGGKISRDSIKALTGETQTARFRKMRQNSSRQPVNCKPYAATNELPHFDKEIDEALLRRIVTIPFTHMFTKEDKDPEIFYKLQKERDAIFSQMVDECIAYRNGGTKNGMKDPGLMPVPEFCKVTQAELLSDIQYTAFIDSMCEKTDGKRKEDRTTKKKIGECFIQWCDANGIGCDTEMKLVAGIDVYGNQFKARCLTQGELKHLYQAFRVKGFYEIKTCGDRYINCRIRQKEQTR